ncbi:response regulator [Mucilaginibacter sp.]|jgi:DNA-binding NarL/FixJ family response regulator|uniref:response regulator n=1 Tax=Mucilaginibacter sp. TaxID=1882438 RepID=UPI00356322BD
MIKIILAEDHNVVRNGIRSLLDKEEDIQVIAEAINGKMALQLLKDGNIPDIILADINMPEMGGMEMVMQISQSHPKIKVIMLSMLDHEKYIMQAFKAGATGYILKNVNAIELVFAIRHVCTSNEKYICNELSLRLLEKLMHTPDNSFEVEVEDLDITKREVEVLALIAEGYTNQEIADKLFTSKRTIEGNRQMLIEKTGTRNTAALIRYAILNNIIS